MAPNELDTSKKQPVKPATPVEDDDKWTDLAEKEDSTPQPETSPPPVIRPLGRGPNRHPMVPPPPPSLPPYLPPMPGSLPPPLTIAQQQLESQLMQLAEIQLGLLNAAEILEKHLYNHEENFPKDINEFQLFTSPGSQRPALINPAFRFNQLISERSNLQQAVRDMAYIIGLNRAVKILREAAADRNRNDSKYTLKLVSSTLPPIPMGPMLPPLPYTPPLLSTQENQLRNLAKDIIKDTVKEVKAENMSTALEEIQKEMIKLCRDVCRDAIGRKNQS